jgi:hypothetical protein
MRVLGFTGGDAEAKLELGKNYSHLFRSMNELPALLTA